MSTFTVDITEVLNVQKHPNADRLDIVTIKGWQCITSKGEFKPGDKCVYIPIDSILPESIEKILFGPDSKVKLHNHRVKTIKLRGAISQGMAVQLNVLGLENSALGTDVTQKLGITKYEPADVPVYMNTPGKKSYKQNNPLFRKYTGIENAKNFPNVFEEGEMVSVSCKLHGSNWRASILPFNADTWWKKVKKFFGLAPKYEFCYGSHNVQLQNKPNFKGFYKTNVYAEMAVKYNIEKRLKPNEAIYGEIIGDGIQKGYMYGCGPGERKLVLFDVMVDGVYLDPIMFKQWCKEREFEHVPILYVGPFNLEKVKALTKGNSVYAPSQKVREGVVVKPIKEELTYIGRKMLKFISDEYLLRDNTDFH